MGTRKISRDNSRFRKMIAGKLNERMSKFIRTGHIMRMRPDGKGNMSIPLPAIDQPMFRHGKLQEGAARGPGKPGDSVGKEYEPGHGPNAGDGEQDGILVDVPMEDVLNVMETDLRLPRMKPKENQTFEAVQIKYHDISKTGPRSLIHKRRSIKQAMKRNIAQGTFGQKVILPGFNTPINVLNITKKDFFYRQWREIKIPRANALIVFGRDGSGSMDDFKCDLVNNLSFWIDTWIKRDYAETETLYLWHDMTAKEVSQHDFYHLRHGGGTKCSSVVALLQDLIKIKYPPHKWNIYFFYFSDGDNINKEDTKLFFDTLVDMEPNLNLFGMGQILAERYDNSVKEYIDNNSDAFRNKDFARTTAVGGDKGDDDDDVFHDSNDPKLDEDMRKAIVDLLGDKKDADSTDLDSFDNYLGASV